MSEREGVERAELVIIDRLAQAVVHVLHAHKAP